MFQDVEVVSCHTYKVLTYFEYEFDFWLDRTVIGASLLKCEVFHLKASVTFWNEASLL
jgi:hypothetical protein